MPMTDASSSVYAMPRVGEQIAGKYRLEKVAGEGGMGVVYAAEHLVLRQRVAVKVLLPDAACSEAVVERFSREAQAAARIQSEHVARVMDAGSLASGAPFLVMEYLEGCDLNELLALEGKLAPTEVADMMLQALEALAHAHAAGIIHRDLKPANLFLHTRPDGSNVVKMLDFGISKAKARPGEKVLTGQAVLGSPVYMSPEQLRNAKEIDGRADLWSLGVVAYELLSGKPPFDGDGVGEIFAAILEQRAVPICERNPAVPPELAAVIDKCLERKVEDRWADTAELARAVAPFGSGAHTPLVERIEQVLARSKHLQSEPTPLETIQIVEAIEAAARRARETGTQSVDAFPLVARRTDLAKPPPSSGSALADADSLLSGRGRLLAVAAAAIVAVGIGAAIAAVRSARLATAEPQSSAVVLTRPPEGRGGPSGGADDTKGARGSTRTGEGTARGASDDDPSDGDSPTVMELPANAANAGGTSGAPRARASKPGKPAPRPKFLNTRE
jgi:serine/threonine-protein kinase